MLGVTGPAGTALAATGEALTSVTRASLQAALAVALRKVSAELRRPLPTRFAVIAMGRFGGHECGYGSDADVLFVHDPLPGRPEKEASDAAHAVAAELRRLLMLPVPDPALIVDADLRPEGRQGPLVRTLASYRAYYRRWSAPWEAQALLRAEPAAGDEDLGARFTRMIAEFRYPLDGIAPAAVREIRRIKARMEAERIPRGADRALHVKLGPGGLSDVECAKRGDDANGAPDICVILLRRLQSAERPERRQEIARRLRRADDPHPLFLEDRNKRTQQGVVASKRCRHDSRQSERAARIKSELGEFRPRHFARQRDLLAARLSEKQNRFAELSQGDEAVGKWSHVGGARHAFQRHDKYGAAMVLGGLSDGNGQLASPCDDS